LYGIRLVPGCYQLRDLVHNRYNLPERHFPGPVSILVAVAATEVAALGNMKLDKKIKLTGNRHLFHPVILKYFHISHHAIKKSGSHEVPSSGVFLVPQSCLFLLLPDRQRQLFQPFHLRHTLPGFSSAAFFRPFHKAASFTKTSFESVFFIHLTSFL